MGTVTPEGNDLVSLAHITDKSASKTEFTHMGHENHMSLGNYVVTIIEDDEVGLDAIGHFG